MSRCETDGAVAARLVSEWKAWHGDAMSDAPHNLSPEPAPKKAPAKERLGGGGPLALLTIVGTVIGGLLGQPSIGFLAGLGLGVIIAIWLWAKGPR
jgi:hypothetical protein